MAITLHVLGVHDKVPIYSGSEVTLHGDHPFDSFFGEDGLGNC